MDISEKDLEDMIFEAAQTVEGQSALRDRGFPIIGKVLRQVTLSDYGRADLLSISCNRLNINGTRGDRYVTIRIYELKKGEIGLSTLGQVDRYKTAVRHFANSIPELKGVHVDIYVVLVGSSIEKGSDFLYSVNSRSDLYLCEYSFGIDGLRFTTYGEGWDFWHKKNAAHPTIKLTTSFYRDMVRLSKWGNESDMFQLDSE
ncbi:hypothetical protein CLV58_10612 [Spirosoma oryzae]|uniref:Uncharacterized protein n=1 Tax=Spirosoma oryzae TaxID=1469603 RepID=A0A2T0T5C1_9BACT|nr:hypothetical protein [Spirosoma oryzae]PRY40829.1 hypothetical protein CLV58_10612 [Spirosoma oryzae]